MKANFIFASGKAIAFLVVTILVMSLFSCCEEPPIELIEPKVELMAPEDVTGNSATLVAVVNPANKNLVVHFEYFDGSHWQTLVKATCSGNKNTTIRQPFSKFEANREYMLRIVLVEWQGDQGILRGISNTKTFTTLNPPIVSVISTQATYTEINLRLTLIPRENNIKVQVEYTVNGQVITKVDPGSYSGETLVTLNFKLDNLAKNTKYPVKIKAQGASASSVIDTMLVTAAVTDYDGNYYRVVEIGKQTWLLDNFKGTHFANGDPIPYVSDQNQWNFMKTPAYCWYNHDTNIGAEYGGLYNWYVASDPRGLITGYHTPEISEWLTLANYLGGVEVAGGKMKEVGNYHWKEGANTGATNSSGFTALPAGIRTNDFGYEGEATTFWSKSKEDFIQSAYSVFINKTYGNAVNAGNVLSLYPTGFSVRLVKN